MPHVFAATFIEKTATPDDYEQGEAPKGTVTTIAQAINVRADSLKGLLELLSREWGLEEMKDVFIDSEQADVLCFTWDRQENRDGEPPSPSRIAAWKKGATYLWNARYTFMIEKREVTPVTLEDFKREGISFHD